MRKDVEVTDIERILREALTLQSPHALDFRREAALIGLAIIEASRATTESQSNHVTQPEEK
jgi:hypothetical protein